VSNQEPPAQPNPRAPKAGQGIFPPTRWTLVHQMQDPEAAQLSAKALNELCQIYWQPVFIYIRSWNKSPADAEDLTQGFFSKILSKNSLDLIAPDKGKLRTFILVALKRFLANAHHHESALKRGGGQQAISIDAEWTGSYSKKIEPADGDSPDVLFDRQWALTILNRAIAQLRQSYASGGKEHAFEALLGTISPSAAKRPLAEIATELGISENAAKVASHRLRKRYRQALQEVISDTVESEEAVDEEIRYLMSVFSR
jgi:RNA polymerase sigma factor (sigma-70 family)